jgi:hypothetical protein
MKDEVRSMSISLNEARKLYAKGDESMRTLLLGTFTKDEIENVSYIIDTKLDILRNLLQKMYKANDGWTPNFSTSQDKYIICANYNSHTGMELDTDYWSRRVDSPFIFKDEDIRDDFMNENKEELIEYFSL